MTEVSAPTALLASLALAVRFGRTRKRLLPPASTRYAIRPAAEGGLGYRRFWGWGKRITKFAVDVLGESPAHSSRIEKFLRLQRT